MRMFGQSQISHTIYFEETPSREDHFTSFLIFKCILNLISFLKLFVRNESLLFITIQ